MSGGLSIALLGGSFNPPHVGHWLAAHYVRATQPIDEVWLMPSFRHPFGKPLVAFEHRVAMCEAIAAEASGWLKVSSIEREVGGEGRTIDTLTHLGGVYPAHAFTLVLGSDILKDLPHWKDFEGIRRRAKVLILQRAGYPAPDAVGPPLVEVSSSEVRARLDAGEPVDALVPRRVLAYAQAHRLYRP